MSLYAWLREMGQSAVEVVVAPVVNRVADPIPAETREMATHIGLHRRAPLEDRIDWWRYRNPRATLSPSLEYLQRVYWQKRVASIPTVGQCPDDIETLSDRLFDPHPHAGGGRR